MAAALLGYLILLLFEVKKIEVKGTVYTSEQEVLDWVQEDKYSSNSLYILWKYGSKETKQASSDRKDNCQFEISMGSRCHSEREDI